MDLFLAVLEKFILSCPFTSIMFLHLFIVNKSGGLIHHRPLSVRAPKISTNEWLRIGSTFHSLHAIAAEASPVRLPQGKNACKFRIVASLTLLCNVFLSLMCLFIFSTAGAEDGIEEIVAGGMVLRCLQTRTGIKFVITAEPKTPEMDQVLREIYVLYTDCVLKDPFYELEMPIRSDLFVQAVDALIEKVERSSSSNTKR